ncbi:MAG: hypothetical protein WA208_12405, partial [Thermoanaerobaculia bacterium]
MLNLMRAATRLPGAGRAIAGIVVPIILLFALPAAAQRPVPYWDNGNGGEVKYDPVAWPTEGQWIPYTNGNASINDARTNDPSHGGARPQERVNVSSGCVDQSTPSVYYYYDSVNQVIFYRWRVEAEPNSYAKGPAPGAYSSTDPWLSGQWTVMFDTNGDGYRDYAAHLYGSSGGPSTPIDILNSIWSQTLTNSIDFENDPNIHQLFYNPTGFVQGTSLSTNNQILQFDGTGAVSTVQWPNGASETYWDYGTTRAINITNATCVEYFVDYQIPVAMLNATAEGGPVFTGNTPFAFVFATANSLNDPFQKDVVLNGAYVCPPTAPAPFGDPLTLNGGIIEQAIVTSVSAGAGSCSAIPLKAQILDTLFIVNCQTITTLVTAQFVYYYDINGDGMDNDGGAWIGIAQPTNPLGTTVQASWDISNLVRGNYLVALELTDNQGNVTRSYLPDDIPGGTYYANLPDKGINAGTYGVNYIRQVVGGTCGAPPPTMTKVATPAPPTAVAGGANVVYTLTIQNTSATVVQVSQITDTLPAGFSYASDAGGTLGAATTSPTAGATGTITWTFSPTVSIPGASSRTFLFNTTAGTTNGTFYNSAVALTNLGTITGNDTTGVLVKNARAALTKSSALASLPGTPASSFTQGDVVRFTVNYSNVGDEIITSAVLSDPLPVGFTYVGTSLAACGTAPCLQSAPAVGANGTVTWSLGNIAVGGSGSVTVDATATAAGAFTNVATLTGGNLPATQASKAVTVSGPILEIAKTANKSVILPLQQLVYTIAYANSGQATATGVVVSDPIPAGFTYVSATPAPTSAPAVGANGTVSWTIGNLAVGGSGVLTVTVTAPASFSGSTIDNTATITSTNALTKTSTYTVETISSTCTSTTYYPIPTTASISSSGMVTGITVTTGGSGYVIATPPTVTITGGGGTGATAVARVSKTGTGGAPISVIGIDIINPGTGYTSAPTVTIAAPGAGTQATATATFGTSFRTMTTVAPTGTGTTTPTFTIGEQSREIIRFYTDAPDPTKAYEVSPITTAGSIVLNWFKVSGNKVKTTVKLVDFDPATNTVVDIPGATVTGTGVTQSGQATYVTETLTWPAFATYALKAGRKLGFVISAADSNANSVTDGQFFYGGGAPQYDSRFPVCFRELTQSVTKAANKTVVDPTTAAPTNQITYTLTYQNPNTVALTGVVLSDPLPAGFTYVSSSPVATSAPAVGANGTVTWNIGTVAAAGTGSVTVTATVTNAVAGATATNTVTLTSNEAPTKVASVVTQIFRPKPNVEIAKTASALNHAPGGTFSYTITITNSGAGPAGNVVVTDTLPTYLSFNGAVTDSPVAGSISVVGTTLTYTLATLASGASATLTLPVQFAAAGVIPAGTTTVTNTGSLTDDYNATPRTASVDVYVTATPTLTLTETAVPSTQRVVYVDVTNGGSGYTTAPTVTFTGGACTTAPVGYANISSGIVTGVTITEPGAGCTSAPIIGFTGGGGLGAAATATIGPRPGDTILYTLTVTNTGNAAATGVVVSDPPSSYTSFTSATAGGTFSGGTVSWPVGTLAPGASAVVTYTVTVSDGLPKGVTSITTLGHATSTNTASPPDTPTAVNTGAAPAYALSKYPTGVTEAYPIATVVTNIDPQWVQVNSASLASIGNLVAFETSPGVYAIRQIIDKTTNRIQLDTALTPLPDSLVLPALEFTLNYSNTGSALGTSVTVTDLLPGNLRYAGHVTGYPVPTSTPGIGSSGTITWTIGNLTNGDSGQLKYYAFASAAGEYTNTARISDGTTFTPDTYNATTSATNTFGALVPWKATSTPTVNNLATGVTPRPVATYTITVTNPLATAATGVSVTDNLTIGFTYKTGTTLVNGVAAADPGGTAQNPIWSGLTVPGNGSLTINFSAEIDGNVANGTYQNEILVSGAKSLEFDYFATTDEDVKVCNPAPPIVVADACANLSSGAAVERLAGATYTWTITNGNGTITNYSTGAIYKVVLGSGGSGYTGPSFNVTFTGGGGSGATARANVTGGVITSITITDTGSGFTSAPTVDFSAGGGSGATAAAVIGEGIRYTAGASGTVDIQVQVSRAGCITSSTASATILPATPDITGRPTDDTVCNNQNATFAATAVSATTLQWEISTDNGATWSNVVASAHYTGSTTNTLTVVNATVAGDNGHQFRLRAANSSCTVYSNAVTLTVINGGTCNDADMTVPKNDDTPDPVYAGDNITYVQNVANIGTGTASTVSFTQTTPANTTFVSMTPPAGWTCGTLPAVGGTGAITCTIASVAGGVTSGDFTLVLATLPTTPEGTVITLNATVSTVTPESVTTNNSRSTTTTVTRRVDVGVYKTNDATNWYYGTGYLFVGNPPQPTPLTYTMRVTNGGTITGITVTGGGSGYDTTPPTVTITGGGGTG